MKSFGLLFQMGRGKSFNKFGKIEKIFSYIHTNNLLDLLNKVDDNVPLIIGSRQTKINLLRSIFSNLFPFFGISSTDWPISATISTDVPIIISPKAFFTISRLCGVQSTNYVTRVPQHTGRTIGGCAIQMGIALLDPIDEESRPLIVKRNLRAIFSKSEQLQSKKSLNSTILQINECCSDRAIAFGLLNHKDQRLLDFGLEDLKFLEKTDFDKHLKFTKHQINKGNTN
uniref:Uncharacterized protein n=1 Tax=Meloidogyne enterolobii TaxID=390850 RepID=A0A6V7TUC9_MELEN|nr:unnamed protein product [Meloidogyne enterolobii]